MAEELQSLLERIQKDGVEKAETEAQTILESAKAKATNILDDARAEAERTIKDAQQEADQFLASGNRSLEQAARDVILSVHNSISESFRQIVEHRTEDTLDSDTLRQMLIKVVTAYCEDGSGMEISLAEEDRTKIADSLLGGLSEKVRTGIEIRGVGGLHGGFRVSMDNGAIEHDFSEEAITEAICSLLRPRLAEILKGNETEEG